MKLNDDRSGGEVLVVRLDDERKQAAASAPRERSGRRARTLVKDGPLRVTLVELDPGGTIAEHRADGPITVQPVEGRLLFTAGGREHDIGPGELLAVAAGVRHSVASPTGALFLLTLCLS